MRKIKLLTLFITVLTMVFAMMPQTAFAADSVTAQSSSSISKGNRVYFYNMSGGDATLSDCIFIESNGHWGMIDSGHRKSSRISDGKNTYDCLQKNGLSSQVSGKNGIDAVKYMVESLGITHLDFVIGTHAHSDHIGGIPEICNLLVTNPTTKKQSYLVDNNTVYIYKPYNSVNYTNDIAWRNNAYYHEATEAMRKRGAYMFDIADGTFVTPDPQPMRNYYSQIQRLKSMNLFKNIDFRMGSIGTYYDDYFKFTFGAMDIRLYNIYMHHTKIDENVNSIVAVISYNGNKLVSTADINVEDSAEQQVSSYIRKDFGTIDVMKAPHHGVTRGSNSKELYDNLQPKKVLATRDVTNVNSTQAAGAYANAMKYAKSKYGTKFYEVGASGYALVVDMNAKGAPVYNLTGRGKYAKLVSGNSCIGNMRYANGWSNWDNKWYWNGSRQVTDRDIYYFQNNNYKTGWFKWYGDWYFLKSNGVMSHGWEKIGNKWYYFENDDSSGTYGRMMTGWQLVNNKWYYMNGSGEMQTGWIKLNGIWYYLKSDGSMVVYTQNINGKTYYFNGAGKMQTGFVKFNAGYTRYFNSDGSMQTGWKKINNKWHYFKSNGNMVVYTQNIDGNTYYFTGSGQMCTGWVQCVNKSLKDYGKWRYFNASGAMQKGPAVINGKQYLFAYADGYTVIGWYHNSNGDYYYNYDGSAANGYIVTEKNPNGTTNTERRPYYFRNGQLWEK